MAEWLELTQLAMHLYEGKAPMKSDPRMIQDGLFLFSRMSTTHSLNTASYLSHMHLNAPTQKTGERR